ncbi:hypothetical protein Peur_033937 [Populus x canadensis]
MFKIYQFYAIATEKLLDLNCTAHWTSIENHTGTAANMGIEVDLHVLGPKMRAVLVHLRRRGLHFLEAGLERKFVDQKYRGSLRIKATKVDWLWGSLSIPKHSALDRLSTEAEQLRRGRKTDTDCALCQQQDEREKESFAF